MSATQLKESGFAGSDDVLAKLVRFAIDVTKGVTTVTEQEGRVLIDKVIGAGKLTKDDGDQLFGALVARMERSRARFEKRVEGAVQQAIAELSKISNKELDHLRLKTAELERRVSQL